MQFFIPFLFLLFTHFTSFAQTSLWSTKEKMMVTKKEETGRLLKNQVEHIKQWGTDTNYHRVLYISARFNSNGWSTGLVYQTKSSTPLKNIYSLQFSEIKHEKETKQEQTGDFYKALGKSKPFIFGKVNNVYTLQLAYGKELMLLPAILDNNMSISAQFKIGPSFALLKPYYIQLIHKEYTPDEKITLSSEKYTQDNQEQFLLQTAILGADKWRSGLKEISLVPGVFGEFAFIADAGKQKSMLRSVTIGANIAYYTQPLIIIAERNAYSLQASVFIGMQLGKRW